MISLGRGQSRPLPRLGRHCVSDSAVLESRSLKMQRREMSRDGTGGHPKLTYVEVVDMNLCAGVQERL